MNPEPYTYGTKITLSSGGRHELLTAYVVSSCTTSDGYRYHCTFPCKCGTRWANVYSDEIESAEAVDENTTRRLMEAAR